jgi:drug/metabolite transporter (DMT)-like permease
MTNDLLAAALHATAGPPRQFWEALLPIIGLAVVFDVYCLADVIRAKSVQRLPKGVWAVVILISAPWGGLAYLFLGRDRRHHGIEQP